MRTARRSRFGVALPLCAAIVSASGAVHARTPSIAECAAIDADSERLACYDRASGRATAAAIGRRAAVGPPTLPVPRPADGASARRLHPRWSRQSRPRQPRRHR